MDLELKTRVELLQCNQKKLPASKRDFANSLCFQFGKKGDLSPKQAEWVGKLLDMIFDAPEQPVAAPIHNLSYPSVFKLFEHAGQSLKKPAISLKTAIGIPVTIKPAGSNSKNPGALYVVGGGSSHTTNKTYFGKIAPDGNWFPAKEVQHTQALAHVEALLESLNNNPAAVATGYGKDTGYCCFCCKALTDPKSVKVGYGPVCAGHYGLPWGA